MINLIKPSGHCSLPIVLGVCRRVLRNHHDAEDAFQAAFLILVGKANSVWPREMVGNWLHGVAYRIALRARAIAARRQTREKYLPEMPEPETTPQVVENEWQSLLDRELDCVPLKYRLPVLLCDLEGKTIKEATDQLGWPQGTLAGRLARGRKMLAQRLTRRGVGLAGGLPALMVAQSATTASVPASLMGAMVKAANISAANQAPIDGVVPAKVAILMQGAKTGMTQTKFKMVASVLLALGATAFGGGLLARYSGAQQTQPDKRDKEPATRKAVKPAQSLDEKLCGEWITKIENNIQHCLIFGRDGSFGRVGIGDARLADAKDVGTYSVDWSKTPYHLNLKVGDRPAGTMIMEFTSDGKLRIEWPQPDAELPKSFSDQAVVLTKIEKPPLGEKLAAQQAEKDLAVAAYYRRTAMFALAHYYYELVQNRYPGTTHAKLAKEAIEELKKKYLFKLEDGTDVWATPKDVAAIEVHELSQRVLKFEDRLKVIEEKGIISPPPKVNSDLQEPTGEIEVLRQQVKNFESRLAALEAKGSKKGDTVNTIRVGEIIVVGNTVTRTSVIVNQMGLKTGQVLDDQALRSAEKNLAQFNPTIKVIDGDGTAVKDIVVKVREK